MPMCRSNPKRRAWAWSSVSSDRTSSGLATGADGASSSRNVDVVLVSGVSGERITGCLPIPFCPGFRLAPDSS